jgi:hypothetical protein
MVAKACTEVAENENHSNHSVHEKQTVFILLLFFLGGTSDVM